MKIYTHQNLLKQALDCYKKSGKTIGFVPTMGALHQGHLQLVKTALQQNEVVVVSIFVNPTQFNNAEDLEKYPRTLQTDVQKIEALQAKVLIYAPAVEDIYGTAVSSEKFDFEGLDSVMEGAFRPGHFDGVGTVVKKLFEIVTPDNAYFGEKDYQQLLIIKKMVQQTQLAVRIVPCPIVRNENGLALSSRNQRLSHLMQAKAPFIYQTLLQAKAMFVHQPPVQIQQWVMEAFAHQPDFELEYFIIADAHTLQTITHKEQGKKYRAFIAVYAEGIRLIDNIALYEETQED